MVMGRYFICHAFWAAFAQCALTVIDTSDSMHFTPETSRSRPASSASSRSAMLCSASKLCSRSLRGGHDNSGVKTFVKALTNEPDQSKGEVLFLDCEKEICDAMKIYGFEEQEKCPFLLREEYYRIWDDIKADLATGATFAKQPIVIGTAGIGKSCFRFFLIRLWLLGKLGMDFPRVYFNIDNDFFVVSRAGEVSYMGHAVVGDLEALALFDPCKSLDGVQSVMFKLKIVTSSPSPFVGQRNDCSLTQYVKNSDTFHVMRPFTIEEYHKMTPARYHGRITNFCTLVDGVTYCVPRWAMYSDFEVAKKVKNSCSKISQEVLKNFFFCNQQDQVSDAAVPYRLLFIQADQLNSNSWVATGFISNYISKLALKWALSCANLERRNYLALMDNPFSCGLVGTFFENWVFEMFYSGRRLEIVQIVEPLAAPNRSAGARRVRAAHIIRNLPIIRTIANAFLRSTTYKFKTVRTFGWFWASKRKVMNTDEQFDMIPEVLYRPRATKFPSIDGCGIVGSSFIMVKMAVSCGHDTVKWIHIEELVSKAERVFEVLEIKNHENILVYLTPKDRKFTIPDSIEMFDHGIKVTVGQVEGDDFAAAHADLLS